jgi:hypothetical protein
MMYVRKCEQGNLNIPPHCTEPQGRRLVLRVPMNEVQGAHPVSARLQSGHL